MRKNILFSNTRQWNPGDQIIMLGVLHLLRHLDFNKILYNRHPNIWAKGKDNSWKPKKHNMDSIDYYIAAGTPEWASRNMTPLFQQLLDNNIPCSFIGVGGSGAGSGFVEFDKLVHKAELMTGRDRGAARKAKQVGGYWLPCPAFFSAKYNKLRVNSNNPKVGLVFMSDKTGANRVRTEFKPYLIRGYQEVIKKYNTIIICHYIDEALEARKYFPNTPVYYSYDAKDFASFYNQCDITLGPRLHGSIMSASLGIPSYIITDIGREKRRRKGGTEPFDIKSCNSEKPENLIKAIKDMDITKESKRLIRFKKETEIKYLRLFRDNISLYTDKDKEKVNKSIRRLKNDLR